MPSLFEDLIQNIPAIFYRCDCDEHWTMHFINRAITDLCGYPATDFVDNQVRTFASLIHPDDVEYVDESVNDALKQKASWSLEYRVVTRDGAVKWVAETGAGVFSATGEINFLDGFICDISERKKLLLEIETKQDSLADSENFLSAVMKTAVDPIIVISQTGIMEQFNLAAERLFGYKAIETIGENVSMLTPAEHAHKHDGYLEQYLETGEAKIIGIGREVKGLRKDGSLFPMHLAVSEIKHADGRSSFTGIVRDLTEQKRLEAELAKAHKMEAVGQLAAGIAHELNTPIQFIGDNLHFLADAFKELREVVSLNNQLVCQLQSGEDPVLLLEKLQEKAVSSDLQYLIEDIPQSINESSDGVGRISGIVKAMKAFSHPGKTNKESVDLKKMIESTLTVARNEWKYVANVETDFDPDLPVVECFPGEINQVILNLVVNATHAIQSRQEAENTSDKGAIKIKTFKENGFSVIAVSDTGCGIDEEHINKIFDPFFTTKEVGKGTGQGLSMVYSIITDKHKGRIDVESVLGEGTTMNIKLP